MKKRWLLLLGLVTLTMAAGGCGKTEDNSGSSQAVVSSAAGNTDEGETLSQVEVPDDYVPPTTLSELTADLDLDSLVQLGSYKGLKLTKAVAEVTDADIEAAVTDALENTYIEVDRAAQEGDTVNIDYVGTLDGEEFEGGSASGTDLQLGSHAFIDGFEDGLIGAKKGDVVTLNLTFPKSYTEELSGKDVVFKVTVNKVQTTSKEISEEWVKETSDFETVDDFKRDLRVQLETANDANAEATMENEAWKMVLESSVVNEYPEELVQYGRYYYDQLLESYCTENGVTVQQYMEVKGMTAADYKETQTAYAQSMAGQLLVMAAIEKAENISAQDQEYQDSLSQLVASAGVDETTFFSYYERFSVEQSLMLQRINKIIVDNATVTETVAEAQETEEEASGTEETENPAASAAPEAESSVAGGAEGEPAADTSIDKKVLEPIE